jgi:hypothetical protein
MEDLDPWHRVLMKCASCHEGVVSRGPLARRGLPAYRRILDLSYNSRCLSCWQHDVIDLRVITAYNAPSRVPRGLPLE